MSYEFNGMLDSVLPNIYINKITLEQKNFRTTNAANKHDTMSPHIEDFAASPGTSLQAEPSLLPKYSNKLPSLRVIFDLFLEIPNVDGDDFWSFLFDDDISEYLSVNIFLFGGPEAKKYYRHLVEKKPSPVSPEEATMQNIESFLGGLTPGVDYSYKKITSIFSELMPPGTFMGASQDQGISDSQSLAHIMQKYSKTLPDGTVVHKIPIQMEMELTTDEGAFPSDLSAIAYSSLNIEKIEETLKSVQASTADIDSAKENSFGRITTEVIINKGKIQDKGMIFYISKNQIDNDTDMSTRRTAAFGHLSGQLWFGSVHKYKNRFMSGNTHDHDLIHPYLDYVVAPCRRVQDFRQSSIIQKRLMDYTPATNLIINDTTLGNRTTAAASWDNPIIFSDLISSVNHLGRIKLFFSVDWGRLIKKHCAIPALIDILSNNAAELKNLFGNQKPLSLKIYRERVGIPSKAVSESGRKLVYDKYPNIFYNDREMWEGSTTAISALLPITLNNYNFKGFVKHYSLTDYDVKETTKGKFKYSIEITTVDPTLSWLTGKLAQAQDTTNLLSQYVKLATGIPAKGAPATGQAMYNSYLGQFEPGFIEKAELLGFSANGVPNPFVTETINTFILVTTGEPLIPRDLKNAIGNMLDPSAATPDSIVAAYEIFDTLVSQLRDFIEFFSPVKVPKTDTGRFVDDTGTTFSGAPLAGTKTPVGASLPSNKIVATHTFGSPLEIVDTIQMDAGYHFFGDSPNVSNTDMGLKFIDQEEYKKLSNLENFSYVKSVDTPPGTTVGFAGQNAIASIPFKLAVDGTIYPIPSNITSTKGRFFTIQNGANVILPNSIKSNDDIDENQYQFLVNNIIRYKYNLFGNPDETSYLGYDELNKKIPNDWRVKPKMERILKQYQSLAYKGAIFNHQQPKMEDPLISEGNFETSDSFAHPLTGQIASPFRGSMPSNNPLPTSALPVREILSTIALPNRVNWAANVGQEKFLLALIMQHYFDLKLFDINLGTFNANMSKSPIGTLLNESITGGRTLGTLVANWQSVVKAVVDSLPIQIKTLMMNWAHPLGGAPQVATEVDYLAPENGVFDTTDGQSSMFVNKFGQFWFKHQNIVEIEFLSGCGIVSGAGLGGGSSYEKSFGTSSVGAPTWLPLMVSGLPTSPGGVLLCRFKKYRHSIFNQNSYDILDLPLYDEYFFLYLGPGSAPQVEQANAGGKLSTQIVQENLQIQLPAAAGNMLSLL